MGALWERLDALRPTLREMWLFSVSGGKTSDLEQSSRILGPCPTLFPYPSCVSVFCPQIRRKEKQDFEFGQPMPVFGNLFGERVRGDIDSRLSSVKMHGALEMETPPPSRTIIWLMSCKWKALDFSIRNFHLRPSLCSILKRCY